jgi:ribosomal protein S18 acetylase RimI-like enzyme
MISPPVSVRHAVATDLDAILALERATEHAPHWPLAAYREILDQTAAKPSAAIQRCLFIAECFTVDEEAAKIVGFAVGLLHPATQLKDSLSSTLERIAELESVAVALDARRSGVGKGLCRAVIDWCRAQGATEVILEVRANSCDAVTLYASLGFIRAGRRPRYYRAPDDDALILRLRWI